MPDEFAYSPRISQAVPGEAPDSLIVRGAFEDSRGAGQVLSEDPFPDSVFPRDPPPPGEDGSAGHGTGEQAEVSEGGRLEKGVKMIIIAAAAVLLLELGWFLLISPCMPLSRVEVTSFPGLEREEILFWGGIGARSSFISVDPREVEKNLERIKEVETARVTRHFPGTVKILVLPRVAVAMAFTIVDGRQVPVYFDRHGVAFKTGGDPGEAQSLPVLSGLPLEADKPLSPLYLSLFTSLDRIRSANATLLGAISEIKINKKPFDGFDLILYPVHSPIRIRVESTLTEETLRYVMLVLDVLIQENQEIEEIDFRTGTASYKLKEVPSGQ
ncbi:MAG: FtsQ-type POTRA domain-containing protein [Treponema sp.]|jgi:cell division protein FtsQ|nr:FtsQ-type POTRA domain-containing protein [Treponema sp.]